jgi:hypothetical protein
MEFRGHDMMSALDQNIATRNISPFTKALIGDTIPFLATTSSASVA